MKSGAVTTWSREQMQDLRGSSQRPEHRHTCPPGLKHVYGPVVGTRLPVFLSPSGRVLWVSCPDVPLSAGNHPARWQVTDLSDCGRPDRSETPRSELGAVTG